MTPVTRSSLPAQLELVNDRVLITETLNWLLEKEYPELSGVIYMRRFAAYPETDESLLMLIPNPRARNPLYPSMLTGPIALSPKFVTKYVFLLATRIRIPENGWHELIRIEPGLRIFHGNMFFGTLTLP